MDYELITFNVGQGLFNLLCQKQEDTEFCGIFDCGSHNDTKKQYIYCLESAIEIIKDYKNLEFIVISHQDDDHWSYVPPLLKRLYGVDMYNTMGQWIYNEASNRYLCSRGECSFELVMVEGCYWEYYKVGTIKSAESYGYKVLVNILSWKTIFFNVSDKYRICLWIDGETGREWVHFCINDDRMGDEKKVCMDKKKVRKSFFEQCCIDKGLPGNEADEIVGVSDLMYNVLLEVNPDMSAIKQTAVKMETPVNIKIYCGGGNCGRAYSSFKLLMNFFGELKEKSKGSYIMEMAGSEMSKPLKLCGIKELEGKIPAVINNATSSVVFYRLPDNTRILFPGDLTQHVFPYLTEFCRGRDLNTVLMLAPHHGSIDTNYCYENKDTLSEEQPFKDLCSVIGPAAVFISAAKAVFRHPGKQFVKDVFRVCQGDKMHLIDYTDSAGLNLGCCSHELGKTCDFADKQVCSNECCRRVWTTESNGNLYYSDNSISAEKRAKQVSKKIYQLPGDDTFLNPS